MILKKVLTGIFFLVNTYIIGCEETKKGVVIDPGGNIYGIMKIIKQLGIKIEYIFNTHCHADHTGGNRKLKKLSDAKIVMHKGDMPYLRELMNGIKIATLHFSLSPIPDLIIDEETTIKVGNINFKIYHTPGHTPGGICFYTDGKLFTGDTLFVGDSGTTKLKGGDRPALGASIRRIMKELPDDTVIYPGHDYGPTSTSTLHWEKRNNTNAKEYGYYIEN